MGTKATVLGILAVVTVFAATYLVRSYRIHHPDPEDAPDSPPPEVAAAKPATPYQPTPVPTNRGRDVGEGFRGDVHPLLHGHTRLEVTATWTPIGKGRDQIEDAIDGRLYAMFTSLQPSLAEKTYTEADFSGFLPERVGDVGQTWELPDATVMHVLQQFHPIPTLKLVSAGRRAGPNGAFAVLRAASPDYLDVMFRIHAEFSLMPQPPEPTAAHVLAWYTPAYFTGHLVVNRKEGTVEYFHLGLPNDNALNVHLTVAYRNMKTKKQPHDIVRVERMELDGGDRSLVKGVAWTKALSPAEAEHRLSTVFYKFMEIDWVPFDQVAARARSRGQPIFAVVSWGSIDDQSC